MIIYNYIKLNIHNILKNHLGLFLLIMLSEIAAALCILFSYGLVMKMQEDTDELDSGMYFYDFVLHNDKQIAEKAMKFIESMNGDLDNFIIELTVTDKYGKNRICGAGSGENISGDSCILNESMQYLVENGKVRISGKEFEVARVDPDGMAPGTGEGMWCDFWIPTSSVPDAAVGKEMQFHIKSRPTLERVNYIDQTVKEIFNAEILYNPQPVDLMKKQQNNTFYAYAFVIVMITVMNLAMYFRYIVGLRKKQIKIFTTCGATSEDINRIFLFENLLELVAGYAAAFLIFRFGLFRVLLKFYPAFEDYYSAKVYLITLAIFVVGSLLILMLLISPSIRKAAAAGERSV